MKLLKMPSWHLAIDKTERLPKQVEPSADGYSAESATADDATADDSTSTSYRIRRIHREQSVFITRTETGRVPVPAVGRLGMDLYLAADGHMPMSDSMPVRFGDNQFTPEIERLFPPGTEPDDGLVTRTLMRFRKERPDTFGFTVAPDKPIRAPGEYEPCASLRLVYPGWDDHDDFYGTIIAAAVGQGDVHVHLFCPQDRWRLRSLLVAHRVHPSQITVHTTPSIESIWIRDYGPLPVYVDGVLSLVDGRYNVDCVNDDAMPSRLGQQLGVPVHRPPFLLEGGNLLSDGCGTGFVTHHLASINQISEAELAGLLERYFGFSRVVFLEALRGDVIEHIDMLMSIADPETILLAQVDPLLDPDNHKIMSRNLKRLRSLQSSLGRPYRIVQIPCPPPLAYNPGNKNPHHIRSYLNLVPFNGIVLVPTFNAALDLERGALELIASAFPNRELVPVPADAVAMSYGAIHCVTQTLPRIPQAPSL